MTTFTEDQSSAYVGRLGHVDSDYTDPNLSGPKESDEEPAKEEAAEEADEEQAEEQAEEQPESDELESFTVAELKEELDSLGVEYDPKAHKADLIELVRQAETE
jgi:arginyl-tRNA synthetase